MNFLSEEFVAQWASELGWNIITAHHMTLQVMFKFECTRAIFAGELGLYSTFELQMA